MNYNVFFELLKQDIKEKNLGSLFGVFWSFFVPLATIIIMWIVFQYGFKRTDIDGYPYSIWYLAGVIPWFYFADAFMQATNSIKSKSFLIKKTKFNPIFLPTIKIVSNFLIYSVLIIFLLILYKYYGFEFNVYNLQILYYIFCLMIFLFAISLITSSLVLFIRDISEIVAILVRFGMWVTPIFWPIKLVPEKYRWVYDFNPVYYVIAGFRDSLLYKVWFFEKKSTIVFWLLTVCLLYIGIIVFKK
ncbi:MAG: ABC transporter permease, partial [Chlorobi bacterium]|nr:ABC transporter permease [Chlorobiota bacterium]